MLSLNLIRQLQLNFMNPSNSTDVLVMTVEAEVECAGPVLWHFVISRSLSHVAMLLFRFETWFEMR